MQQTIIASLRRSGAGKDYGRFLSGEANDAAKQKYQDLYEQLAEDILEDAADLASSKTCCKCLRKKKPSGTKHVDKLCFSYYRVQRAVAIEWRHGGAMTMLIYNAAFFLLFLLLLSLLSVQLSDASVESPLDSTALSWSDNEGEPFVANNAILDPLLAETWDAGSAEFPTFADIAYPEDVYAYLAGPPSIE